MSSYASTDVTVSRSQEQIRTVLRKHSASRVNFGEDFHPDGSATVGVEFVHRDTMVRLLGQIRPPAADDVTEKHRRQRSGKSRDQIRDELVEQEAKRIWRVLHW